MLDEFVIDKNYIEISKEKLNWKEAIIKSSEPLLKFGHITKEYQQAMINVVEEHGPYIVITENIAMPHARPEMGAKKAGFSILRLKESVSFNDEANTEATLFISLACVDSESHLKMMQYIVSILENKENFKLLFEASDINKIVEMINEVVI